MRKIPISSSLLTFLEELEYTEAALTADEDAELLAPPFTDEISAWEATFKKEREGRRGVIRAEAVVAVRNARLDDKTTRFGAVALGEAGGDRKNTFFRRFFKVAPSLFVRRPLRKQCEETLNVMVVEAEKLDAQHVLRVMGASLKALAKAAIDALDARNKAKGDRTMLGNDVDEWKEGVNTLRLSTYAELLKIAAEKGYGRAWADSFFQNPSGEASGDSEDGKGEEAASTAEAKPAKG